MTEDSFPIFVAKRIAPWAPLILWSGMSIYCLKGTVNEQRAELSKIKQSRIELAVEGAEFSQDSAIKGLRFYDGETTKTYSLDEIRKGVNPWEYTKK